MLDSGARQNRMSREMAVPYGDTAPSKTADTGEGPRWTLGEGLEEGMSRPPYRGEVTAFWKVASHALDMVLSELTNLRFISIRSQG